MDRECIEYAEEHTYFVPHTQDDTPYVDIHVQLLEEQYLQWLDWAKRTNEDHKVGITQDDIQLKAGIQLTADQSTSIEQSLLGKRASTKLMGGSHVPITLPNYVIFVPIDKTVGYQVVLAEVENERQAIIISVGKDDVAPLAPPTGKIQALVLLKVLKACAVVGDTSLLHALCTYARTNAYAHKLEHEYALAIDTYLLKVLHPHDIAYFGVESGEAHEAASHRLKKKGFQEEAQR